MMDNEVTLTEEERRIVEWLRGPTWRNIRLLHRFALAVQMLLWPQDLAEAICGRAANAIERGEHRD